MAKKRPDSEDVVGIYPPPVRVPLTKAGWSALTDADKEKADRAWEEFNDKSFEPLPLADQLVGWENWLQSSVDSPDREIRSDAKYALHHVHAIRKRLARSKNSLREPSELAELERLVEISIYAGQLFEQVYVRQFNDTTKKGQRQENNAATATAGKKAKDLKAREAKHGMAMRAMNWARKEYPNRVGDKTFLETKAADYLGKSLRTLQRWAEQKNS